MKYLLTLCALGLVTLTFGQGDFDHEKSGHHDEKNRHGRRDEFRKRVESALDDIKKTDPEKYEELVKLRQSDPRQFFREMRKTLAPGDQKGSRPNVKGDGHPRDHGSNKRFGERFLNHLKSQDPERFEQLQKLRKENPEEFKKEVRQIFKSFRKKHFKKDERVGPLVKSYRKTTDNAEKERIKAELKLVIEEGFEKRMDAKEEEISRIKKRIETMEKALATFRESKDEICEKRLQELLDRSSGEKETPKKRERHGNHPEPPEDEPIEGPPED